LQGNFHVKNRHISVQILKSAKIIEKEKSLGWFCIDILSSCDNDDYTQIYNGAILLKFARLNGDGITKSYVLTKDGTEVYLGELP
jgi:hypothetical protein